MTYIDHHRAAEKFAHDAETALRRGPPGGPRAKQRLAENGHVYMLYGLAADHEEKEDPMTTALLHRGHPSRVVEVRAYYGVVQLA